MVGRCIAGAEYILSMMLLLLLLLLLVALASHALSTDKIKG